MPLKEILFIIGIFFSNPIVPDFGIQFLFALIIGYFLPKQLISPLNKQLSRISLINKFEKKLQKNKKLNKFKIKTLIPRILVGYLFTYLIGCFCLLLLFIL